MMDTTFQLSSWDLLSVFVRGLLLMLALWGLDKLIDLAPIGRPRRRQFLRLVPVLTALAVLIFLITSARTLLGGHDAAMPYVSALVVVALAVALFSPFLDLVAGVFLKISNVVSVGDEIEVDGISGRVESMGYRRMVVLSSRGEVIIPYASVARKAIVRAPAVRGAFPHVFRLSPMVGQSILGLRRVIAEAALLCHWSSLSRQPQIRSLQSGELEVTVFALHQDFGVEVEAAVRSCVSMFGLQDSDNGAHADLTA